MGMNNERIPFVYCVEGPSCLEDERILNSTFIIAIVQSNEGILRRPRQNPFNNRVRLLNKKFERT